MTKSAAATDLARSGTTASGAGPTLRVFTITQRTYSSTLTPCWFTPVVRTQTTPDAPLEFCFTPITVLCDCSVSPGQTGASQRPSA